ALPISRPPGGGGSGGGQGQASADGEGIDEFVFQISQDEFLDFMFEDLALPNLMQKQLKDISKFKYVRSGYSTTGTPNKINVVRSLRGAYARRLALTGNSRQKIERLEQELAELKARTDLDDPVFRRHGKIGEVEQMIGKPKAASAEMPLH